MNRRNFTRTSIALAGTSSVLIAHNAVAQTPVATPSGSGVWESADDPITIEWDMEIFGEATTSGVTGEWCVLRIEDIEHFLSFIIKLEEKYPTDLQALRDLVENDEELDYPEAAGKLNRLEIAEDNDAVGVLYQPELEAAPDTWSYSEFIPAPNGEHRTIQIWIASRTSKLDREMMEAAVASVTINGEPAVRAMDVTEMFDKVEALETETTE